MTDDREALLEEQVRLLAAGLNLAVDDPTQVIPPAVIAAARAGADSEAAKEIRVLPKPGSPEFVKGLFGRPKRPTNDLSLLEAVRILKAIRPPTQESNRP